MTLSVMLLLVTLVCHSWNSANVFSAPFQWRNWTPQAVLYLKGARKSQSVLLSFLTHSQSSDGLGMSLAASLLLELLRQLVEESNALI
uniref:Uncharacterized protein n=1 Tax=Myripristis murdjan TaxID=586833 RepID=A0A668AKC3_9TELE